MTAAPPDAFRFTDGGEPHRPRTQAILREHPEVRTLIGRNPWSFVAIVSIVAAQTAMAGFMATQPWWILLLVAYCVGAFANHAMYVMIHEATHGLVFRSRWANNLAACLSGTINGLPTAISFRGYHLQHHAFQGVYELDADLPSRWEARLVGRSTVRKAIWLLLYPLFQLFRPVRLKEIRFFNAWTFVDWAIVFSYDAVLVMAFGPKALVYLLASLFFATGLHPLGARWIQEHYLTGDDDQETFSYYGWLNVLTFNVGYHNEHHDFASIPWNRLPQLREMAPEYYKTLESHPSWVRLMYRFLREGDLTPWSRMTRNDRRDIAVSDV
jgi:sphingolipid delta-4 desaturase